MKNKKFFSDWLSKNTELTSSSIEKYVRAINTISNELRKQGLLEGSIYNIKNPTLINSLQDQYFSIPEFYQKDIRGNRMYSNALKYFYKFVDSNIDNPIIHQRKIKYNKLVRDRIPEIIENTGKSFKTEILSDEKYITELKKKLNEEMAEYQETTNDLNALEELADILELMHALAHQYGSSIEKVDQIRKEKADKRGAFNDKIFLIEVEND